MTSEKTMPVFDYKFTVNAPLTAVSNFHHDTRILKEAVATAHFCADSPL
jgi:hypothetical protein